MNGTSIFGAYVQDTLLINYDSWERTYTDIEPGARWRETVTVESSDSEGAPEAGYDEAHLNVIILTL